MSVKLTEDKVAELRQRGGDKAEGRDAVDGLDRGQLGHNSGEPLVGDSYDDYPSRKDLGDPSNKELLRKLAEHDLVGGTDDMVSELTGISVPDMLTKWISDLEAALDLFEIQITPATEPEPILKSILGYEPAGGVVTSHNPLITVELYEHGLSVSEIVEVYNLEGAKSVDKSQVRDSLKNVGLLDGPTTAKQQKQWRNDKYEVNRPRSGDNGTEAVDLTINANDYA